MADIASGARMHQRDDVRVKHWRARIGQLHQHHPAHHFGIAHHQRPQGRSRGGRTHRRHGHKAHRDACFGVGQRIVEAVAILGQWADGAEISTDRGSFTKCLGASRHRRSHLDDVGGQLRGHCHPAAHVFERIRQPGVALMQGRGWAIVLGADHGPIEANHGQRIAHSGHHGHILFARGPHLSGLQIDDMHARSVGRQVGPGPI